MSHKKTQQKKQQKRKVVAKKKVEKRRKRLQEEQKKTNMEFRNNEEQREKLRPIRNDSVDNLFSDKSDLKGEKRKLEDLTPKNKEARVKWLKCPQDQIIMDKLKKNMEVLEALQKEIEEEDKRREEMNKKLEETGAETLKEKLEAIAKVSEE